MSDPLWAQLASADSTHANPGVASEGDCEQLCNAASPGSGATFECTAYEYEATTQRCLLHDGLVLRPRAEAAARSGVTCAIRLSVSVVTMEARAEASATCGRHLKKQSAAETKKRALRLLTGKLRLA